MVEPVTAAAAASQVQDAVTNNSAGLVQSLFTTPANAIAGAAQGLFSWDTVVTAALLGGGIVAARVITPDLTGAVAGAVGKAVGGEEGAKKAREALTIGDKGFGGMIMESLAIGGALAGVYKAGSGALNGMSGGEPASSGLGSIISTVAGVAVIGAIGFVVVGAAKHYMDNGSLTPPPTPGATPVGKVAGK